MNRPAPKLIWLPSLLIVPFAVVLGCGGETPGGSASGSTPAQVVTRGRYEAMTTGTTQEMVRHLAELETRFRATDEAGPRQARAAMRAATQAQIETAEAILERPNVTTEQAGVAAQSLLGNLARRSQDDPAVVDRLLEAVDRIISRFPASPVATYAAQFRVNFLNSAPATLIPDNEVLADKLFAAAIALGEIDPPHPGAPGMIGALAPIAELVGRGEQARRLYTILAERYPEAPEARAASGHASRLGLIGQPAGPIAGPTLDGTGHVSLDDFKGRVVLVDFWDTNCQASIFEFPILKQVRARLGPDKFEVLGVNLDPRPLDAASFIKKFGGDWPQISIVRESDDSEDHRAEFPARFGLDRIPIKLLVDPDGNVLATGVTLRELKPAFDKLFPDILPKELDTPADLRSMLPKPEKKKDQQEGAHAGHSH
jgi:thiol-disulfide isomerase/thioredoxin